jgi:hypothetical protein
MNLGAKALVREQLSLVPTATAASALGASVKDNSPSGAADDKFASALLRLPVCYLVSMQFRAFVFFMAKSLVVSLGSMLQYRSVR